MQSLKCRTLIKSKELKMSNKYFQAEKDNSVSVRNNTNYDCGNAEDYMEYKYFEW